MSKKKRITIYEVARETNTSIATVSKALNGKADISDHTRKRILEAVGRLGFSASKTASSISRKHLNFIMLLPGKINNYTTEIVHGVQQTLNDLHDFHVDVELRLVENSAVTFSKVLEQYAEIGYDGAILVPPKDIRLLSSLIIQSKSLRNFPIASIMTDIDKEARLFCVQNNALMSGRLAAELLCIALDGHGKAAFVTGDSDVQVQYLNAEGFFSEMKLNGLTSAGIYEHYNNSNLARDLAEKLMEAHPDLNGIYISSAVSTTFINRLRELGCLKKLKIVASDVFPQMIDFIRNGDVMATIYQNPHKLGRLALSHIYEYLIMQRTFESDVFLTYPQLVLKSNLENFEMMLLEKIDNTLLP